MKIIDKLILKSYLGPFFATLTVLQFIFLMQFLWKYIDDLVGKGLDLFVIFELLYYSNFTLLPMTLPLAVLLSAIMSMGSLSEHFELTALKSSGISFLRILRPLLVVSLLMSGVAFIFSNHLLPWSELKGKLILRDVKKKKLEVNLIEGAFYSDLSGYSIRVDKKLDNKEDVEGLTIYKFDSKGNTIVIKSKKGKIRFSDNMNYFIVDMIDGYNYEEEFKQHGVLSEEYPQNRTYFKKQRIRVDIRDHKKSETKEEYYSSRPKMMTLSQLLVDESKKKIKVDKAYEGLDDRIKHTIDVYTESQDTLVLDEVSLKNWNEIISKGKMDLVMKLAKSNTNTTISRIKAGYNTYNSRSKSYRQTIIQKHKKFTLSYAVVVLFLVGAPLGALIKKGGMGLPIVISVIFFLIYYMVTLYGEKSVLKNQLDSTFGMWITNIIFTPFGILFMYQSATDSPLFDRDFYKKKFKKWFNK